MHLSDRLERIVSLVETRGHVEVRELSELFGISEVTVRRDLRRLHAARRLRRTSGGAVSLASRAVEAVHGTPLPTNGGTIDQVDVLIVSSRDPDTAAMLVGPAVSRNIPIVAEAAGTPGMRTLVSANNYQAGLDLGQWAARYAEVHFGGKVFALDLTYDMHNTQQRSQGFIDGLKDVLPASEICLSANSQAHFQTAYQLTSDALNVYPHINVIFAVNDLTAQGASQACADLGIPPAALLILPFGLEGNIMKDALVAESYIRAGVAMFPEIVGRQCIEAAIAAYSHEPLESSVETPHTILTRDTLAEYYTRTPHGWRINWKAVETHLNYRLKPGKHREIPDRVRFVIPFAEHEWYKNLVIAMQAQADDYGISLEIISTSQTLQEELTLRRRAIARAAAQQVRPRDAIILDDGEVTALLAEELTGQRDITVITNSITVFDLLRGHSGINLILTGGLLGQNGTSFVGPIAASVLRDLCADKLFLAVDGISISFGLSHSTLEEVPVKQAMLQSAKEIILLADHTKFKHTAIAHIAPITSAERLITDNALPASIRLELMKLGVEVVLAQSLPT